TVPELGEHSHSASFTAASSAVEMQVSTESATINVPVDGSYLASNAAEAFYRADAGGATAALGGVSGGETETGTVTVGSTGSNKKFSLMQPSLALNYCIAIQGLFPSRN
ncbi:MAG: hypothetical protein MJK04_24115, partial [Psychrosphaera sp.]|nr:hypothetical protein [Psychrosphaera sp.]